MPEVIALNEVVSQIKAVLAEEHSALEVIGVSGSEGSGEYVEVVLSIRGCHQEPCRLLIGLQRTPRESSLREEIREKLRDHLAS